MKNMCCLSLLLFSIFLSACEKETFDGNDDAENTVYISTQADFDQWSGHVFAEGSKVLFAAGEKFTGQFIVKGSGTEQAPNILTAYDPVTNTIYKDWIDKKPIIEGKGKVSATLLLSNGAFWEINNLELTNTDGTTEDQGNIHGINVLAENQGVVNDVFIRNCYVHHVNGNVGGKKTGGIYVQVLGDRVVTRFHNLIIEDNKIAHTGGVGISNQSSWGSIVSDNYHPWTNFFIRNNRVEHTGRNGIIVRYALDAVVEYNILAYNSRHDTGHSIFNFNTKNCIIQYNEAYGNTSDNPDDSDRGGFDADWNSEGTIIQYNYSHDNNWFCGIMRKPYHKDITIRYNVSQNELLGAYFYGFPWTEGVEDVKVYNNTHYFGKGKGNRVFVSTGKERIPTETTFRNNIFYFEDQADWGFEPDSTCLLENNLYYNVSPRGFNAITANPSFVDPGTGATDIDMTDPGRLSGYRLKNGSPAENNGIELENHPGRDFLGNAVEGKPDIGAFEMEN